MCALTSFGVHSVVAVSVQALGLSQKWLRGKEWLPCMLAVAVLLNQPITLSSGAATRRACMLCAPTPVYQVKNAILSSVDVVPGAALSITGVRSSRTIGGLNHFSWGRSCVQIRTLCTCCDVWQKLCWPCKMQGRLNVQRALQTLLLNATASLAAAPATLPAAAKSELLLLQ
jgi:hypothetical protein